MAYRKKQEAILSALDPSILVIQECEHPNKITGLDADSVLWIGDNPNKGLAIISRRGIGLRQVPIPREIVRHMLVAETDTGHKIVAFWAMNDKANVRQRYIGQVWKGLTHVAEFINNRTIVLDTYVLSSQEPESL